MSKDATRFYEYSAILLIFPLGCIILLILQLLSDRSLSKSKISDRYTKLLLFAVYTSSCCCGIIGFSLHFSSNISWCQTFGMIPCFGMLGGSKAILYLFFLQRAKLAQGMITSDCLRIFFKYIGPSYLFFYWILYCILTAIFFDGEYVENDFISYCFFGKWQIWFCIFFGCIDIFNTISSLSLFSYPLIRIMHETKIMDNLHDIDKQRNNNNHQQYVSAMKWNIILTAIAMISSVLSLFMTAIGSHYIWLFCLGDPFINALSTFLMMASNREFIAKICRQNTNHRSNNNSQKPSISAPNLNKKNNGKMDVEKQKNNHVTTGENGENERNNNNKKHTMISKIILLTMNGLNKNATNSEDVDVSELPQLTLCISNSNMSPTRSPKSFITVVSDENIATDAIQEEEKENDDK